MVVVVDLVLFLVGVVLFVVDVEIVVLGGCGGDLELVVVWRLVYGCAFDWSS